MSQDATLQNFEIRRGDDWGDEVTLWFRNGDGTPMDLTNAEIWMSFRDAPIRSATATDVTHPPTVQITSPAVVGGPGGITILDAVTGQARPALTPAQTKLLVRRLYTYDVQVRTAVGALAGKIKTTQEGNVETLDERSLAS